MTLEFSTVNSFLLRHSNWYLNDYLLKFDAYLEKEFIHVFDTWEKFTLNQKEYVRYAKMELPSENYMKRTNYKVAHPPMHFKLHFIFLLKSAGPRYPSSGFKKLLKSSCLRIEKIFFTRSFLITLSVKQISEWKSKVYLLQKTCT